MTEPTALTPPPERQTMDFIIRVAALAGVTYLCFRLALPFLETILWGLVLAAGLVPLFEKVVKLLRGRRNWAAAALALVLLALLLVPVLLLGGSLIDGVQGLARGLRDGTLHVPPPKESVAQWPLIGPKVSGLWQAASDNLTAFLEAESQSMQKLAVRTVGMATGAALAVLQFILAIVIAAVMLSKAEAGEKLARAVAARLTGGTGGDLVGLAAQTIRSVAVGVLGVALLQSLLGALGLLLAGVPAAGLLWLVMLVLCVVQLGPGLVMIPVSIWLFGNGDVTTATLFTVWTAVLIPFDNILKPLLLGRGVKVPMLVVFIGALGGFMRSGIIGLFTGAVVLVMGYEFFQAWLKQRAVALEKAEAEAAAAGGEQA